MPNTDVLGLKAAIDSDDVLSLLLYLKKLATPNAWFPIVVQNIDGTKDTIHFTPLTYALYKVKFNIAHILLDAGVSPKIHNPLWFTVFAAQTAKYVPNTPSNIPEVKKMLAKLIRLGADINSQTGSVISSFTPNSFLHAVETDYYELVKWFVKRGVDISLTGSNGATCLHLAAMTGNFTMFKYLITHSADISTVDTYGKTPLTYCTGEDSSIPRYLINKKFDINEVNYAGQTILHRAAMMNNFELAEFLIKKGIDVDAKCHEDQTAYDLAVLNNSAQTCLILKGSI